MTGPARSALLAAALLVPLPGAAGALQTAPAGAPGRPAPPPTRALDVPYAPQSEALCGGAAAAMVMQYWGAEDVRPAAFSRLVDEAAGGIRTGDLVSDLEARGWRPHAFRGRLDDLRRHVERGRPVTVLLEAGPGRHHYVVVVAMSEDEVVFHDPARAPFRTVGRGDFLRRWSASDRWTLLLLPPATSPDPAGAGERPGAPAAEDACAGTVRTAVRRAVEGGEEDVAAADSLLRRAAERCPSAPAPRRELAGLRFRQERWSDASAWAREALAVAPADSQAADLLAASRYLADEEKGALAAWNRVGRPKVASIRVYGLERGRWGTVAPRLGVAEGDLLTADRLALARRRAASVPALGTARVRYRPRADGRADLQVAVVERPRLFGSPIEAAVTALSSLPRRELRLAAAGLVGAGESWTARWRWREDRPAVGLTAAFPAAFGVQGRWEVRAAWERESFRGAAGRRREERATAALGLSRWATGTLRWEAGLALERWGDRGAFLRPSAALDLRPAEGRAAVRIEAAAWTGVDETEAFPRAAVEAAWRPVRAGGVGWTLEVRAGGEAVASEAPRSLWPGAGTGDARRPLLRGHPLLDDGVVAGPGFGRALAHGGAEVRAWLVRIGPVRAGLAGFVDAARPWGGAASVGGGPRDGGADLLVDAGAGVRIAPGADAGHLRLDLAGGLRDDAGAVSVGWSAPWPGW